MTAARSARRRQPRGERRIEQILEAASAVFAESGYEAATTNAIAARAGVSPGSLYQFFANKEDIAAALADRYASGLRSAQELMAPAAADESLEDLLDRIVYPLVDFNLSNPAFRSLLADASVPERVSRATRQLQDTLMGRIEEVIGSMSTATVQADRRRAAVVVVQLFKGMLPVIEASAGRERAAYLRELKAAIRAYLASR